MNKIQPIQHILLIEGPQGKNTISLEEPSYSLVRADDSIVVSAHKEESVYANIIRRTNNKNNTCSFLIISGNLNDIKNRQGVVINGKKCFIHELKHGDVIDFEFNVTGHYYTVTNSDIFSQLELLNHQVQPLNPSTLAQPQSQEFYAPVADLPNQALFKEQLATAFALAKRHRYIMAVMFVALDPSKTINDSSLEHRLSNQLLHRFTQRVSSCLRSGDTLAYWRKNELALLLPQVKQNDNVAQVGQRVLEALEEPLALEQHQFKLRSSIGIAVYPLDGEDAETITGRAEAALYRSKKQDTNNYQFYNSEMTFKASERLKLISLLQEALENNEFKLFYQPLVKTNTNQIGAIEAFLRWSHPEIGQIAPERLISLAEDINLTAPLAQWVLRTACTQNRAWQEAGLPPTRVAVNLSPKQFQQPNLVESVAQVLQQTGLDPHWLELEITEATIREDVDFARRTLLELHEMGVCTSIDDFGIGYSSLSDLINFPLHALKIAQSLIANLDQPKHQAIVSAAIAVGQAFNFNVVAEGVETPAQLDILRRLQCEEMQGYYFCEPLNAAEAADLLANWQVNRREISIV